MHRIGEKSPSRAQSTPSVITSSIPKVLLIRSFGQSLFGERQKGFRFPLQQAQTDGSCYTSKTLTSDGHRSSAWSRAWRLEVKSPIRHAVSPAEQIQFVWYSLISLDSRARESLSSTAASTEKHHFTSLFVPYGRDGNSYALQIRDLSTERCI